MTRIAEKKRPHRIEIIIVWTGRGYLETDAAWEGIEPARASLSHHEPFSLPGTDSLGKTVSARSLDAGAAGEAAADVAVLPPVGRGAEGDEEPEQGADEVDPDGILHAHDGAVAVRMGMEEELVGGCCVSKKDSAPRMEEKAAATYLGKDAKEGNVEDEEDQVPDGRDDAERVKHKRHQVGEAGDAGETADDDGKDLGECVSGLYFPSWWEGGGGELRTHFESRCACSSRARWTSVAYRPMMARPRTKSRK